MGSFKEGIEEGFDKLPLAIEKKLKDGKALTANEEHLKAALEDLAEDRLLPPEERIQWMLQFEEDYLYANEYSDDELVDQDTIVAPTPPPKKAKKKAKTKKVKEPPLVTAQDDIVDA